MIWWWSLEMFSFWLGKRLNPLGPNDLIQNSREDEEHPLCSVFLPQRELPQGSHWDDSILGGQFHDLSLDLPYFSENHVWKALQGYRVQPILFFSFDSYSSLPQPFPVVTGSHLHASSDGMLTRSGSSNLGGYFDCSNSLPHTRVKTEIIKNCIKQFPNEKMFWRNEPSSKYELCFQVMANYGGKGRMRRDETELPVSYCHWYYLCISLATPLDMSSLRQNLCLINFESQETNTMLSTQWAFNVYLWNE